MGAWGGGLYDSDFAQELRIDIGAMYRVPLSDDELLARLAAAHEQVDAEHVDAFDYWLVLADQLERRGLHRREVFERAIAIIEGGLDIAALEALDAQPKALARRRKVTAELLTRLRNPRPAKQRRPLTRPQPLLFRTGDALAWPSDRGQCIGPYVPGGFKQDGWGFGIVTDAGHEHGVFARYVVQILKWRRPERPSPDLAAHCPRSEHFEGEITRRVVDALRIERIGTVPPEAISPPPDARNTRTIGIPFGLDAFNHLFWNSEKFPFPAPSGTPLDPDEPDQRPGFEEFLAELDAGTARREGGQGPDSPAP